jgi:hypothetical protein
MQLRKQKGYHANNDKIPLFSPLKYYLITIKPQLEKHHIKKIATESTKRHGMFFITTKAFSLIPPRSAEARRKEIFILCLGGSVVNAEITLLTIRLCHIADG